MTVGTFVIQNEDTKSIKEALNLLKDWNSEWKPANFMVDYCHAEIQALEQTFPGKFITFGLKVLHIMQFILFK